MSQVNQRGDEIVSTMLFAGYDQGESLEECVQAIALLCRHFRVEILRTNATKHGDTQLELRTPID